jgi:hypothetical protein
MSRLSALTAELVALAPDVNFANGTANLAALKRATRSFPIVLRL